MWENSMWRKCTPPPCKHMQTCNPLFFLRGYCLPPVYRCVNYPLSFYGSSALNIYPLQNDPALLIELVKGGGSTGEGGLGGYLGGGKPILPLPPLVHPKSLFQGSPLQPPLFFCLRRRHRKD